MVAVACVENIFWWCYLGKDNIINFKDDFVKIVMHLHYILDISNVTVKKAI